MAASKALQRYQQAEASGDEPRCKRSACRSRGARKRADYAQNLAMEKANAAGLGLSTVAAPETDPLAILQRTLPTDAAGNPNPSAQRYFTDPDSHILKGADGWMQGYNFEAAVDVDHQVIVTIGVSN